MMDTSVLDMTRASNDLSASCTVFKSVSFFILNVLTHCMYNVFVCIFSCNPIMLFV